MSEFTVVVVLENNEVVANATETSVEVKPIDGPQLDISEESKYLDVNQTIKQIEIIQAAPFTVEVYETVASGCCDPSTLDIPALTITKKYSEILTRFDVVSASSSTEIQKASITSLSGSTVMGICLEDGIVSFDGRIHILGVLEDAVFNYPVNTPLFLGVGGTITDTPTTISGEFVTQIGYSLGTGAIFISISEPTEIL